MRRSKAVCRARSTTSVNSLTSPALSERTVPVRPLVSPTLRTIRPQDKPRVRSTV